MNSDLYRRLSDPTSLILFLLVVITLFANWNYSQRTLGADFYVAWTVVDSRRQGLDYNIYNLQQQKKVFQQYRDNALAEGPRSRRAAFAKVPLFLATASPFLYATVSIVPNGDYESSLSIWNAITLISFSTGILLMSNLLGFSRTASLALLLPCLIWMEAFHSDLRVANVNSIQLGLLALAYYLLSRDAKTVYLFLGGMLVGMIALLKPNLAPVSVLFLGAWLIRGQRRKFFIGLAGMASGGLFAFGSSSLYFGDAGVWLDWLHRLFRLTRSGASPAPGNFNPLRASGVSMGPQGQIAVAMALCALALGFLWWGRTSGRTSREQMPEDSHPRELIENAQLIGMGCLVHMIASPLVWLHYYVLAIPMLIVAFRPWSRAPAYGAYSVILQRILPALVLLAFLNGPHWSLFYDDTQASHAVPYIAAVITLYLLGLWQLRFQDGRLPARAD